MLSDVDDPEIYAAQPLYDWEHSEQGQWAKQHSTIPVSYQITTDYHQWGYTVQIYGDLKPKDLTFFKLKWGK